MANTNITPATGSIGFNGSGATGGPINTSTDSMGSGWGVGLAFIGIKPTVRNTTNDKDITTGAPDALQLTGYTPTVNINHYRDVGTDALSFTGYAPSVEIDHVVDVPTGSVTFSGNTPTLAYSWTITPTTGSLQFTGYAPTASTADNKITLPGIGSLQFTGYAPTVEIDHFVDVPTGSITFTGYTPDVDDGVSLTPKPGTGSLTFTGYAPLVSTAITVPTGAISFAGISIDIEVAGSGTSITNPDATTSVPSNYEQCDFTGFRQLPGSLKMTWNKHAVRKKSWEERHPQDVLRGAPERQKGSRRPEKEDRFIDDIGAVDADDL